MSPRLTCREERAISTDRVEPAKRPFRVCHVSLSLETGGLERLISDLAHHADRKRFDYRFLALKTLGRFGDEIAQLGYPVDRCPSTNSLSRMIWLRRYFQRFSCDLVHTHNTFPAIHGTLGARLAGVPIVINTRHGQRLGHGWKTRLQFRLAARWIDRIVAVSQDAANLTKQIDGIPEPKVAQIWNGIRLDAFSFTEGNHSPTAIAIGRLAPEKDLVTLIRGVHLAQQSMPELKLCIVGKGQEEPRLRELVHSLDAHGIEFLGEQSDVASCLRQAGFLVSTSLSEGISLTLLEALAVGLPVIATNVGGNPEIVTDPQCLIPPGQPQAVAEAIQRLWSRREEWSLMAQLNRLHIEQHFDAREMTRKYEALYSQLLAKASAGTFGQRDEMELAR